MDAPDQHPLRQRQGQKHRRPRPSAEHPGREAGGRPDAQRHQRDMRPRHQAGEHDQRGALRHQRDGLSRRVYHPDQRAGQRIGRVEVTRRTKRIKLLCNCPVLF